MQFLKSMALQFTKVLAPSMEFLQYQNTVFHQRTLTLAIQVARLALTGTNRINFIAPSNYYYNYCQHKIKLIIFTPVNQTLTWFPRLKLKLRRHRPAQPQETLQLAVHPKAAKMVLILVLLHYLVILELTKLSREKEPSVPMNWKEILRLLVVDQDQLKDYLLSSEVLGNADTLTQWNSTRLVLLILIKFGEKQIVGKITIVSLPAKK